MTEDAIRRQIERALVYAGGSHTVDDVIEQCHRGEMQMWEGTQSVVVTQILTYPRLKELCFFIAAGKMSEMQRLGPIIWAWGKEQGCTRAVFVGRPGWARSFLTLEQGWISKLAVFEKEL